MNKLVTLQFDLSKPEDSGVYQAFEKIHDTHAAIQKFKEELKDNEELLAKYVKNFSDFGIGV